MSAYLLEDEKISVLVDAFLDYGVEFRSEGYQKPIQIIYYANELRQSIGQELVNKNMDSVNYRYSENTAYPKFRYIPDEQRSDKYKYNPATLYRTIKSYEYNTCEVPTYFESKLHYTMSNLKDAMLERYLEKDGYYDEF